MILWWSQGTTKTGLWVSKAARTARKHLRCLIFKRDLPSSPLRAFNQYKTNHFWSSGLHLHLNVVVLCHLGDPTDQGGTGWHRMGRVHPVAMCPNIKKSFIHPNWRNRGSRSCGMLALKTMMDYWDITSELDSWGASSSLTHGSCSKARSISRRLCRFSSPSLLP